MRISDRPRSLRVLIASLILAPGPWTFLPSSSLADHQGAEANSVVIAKDGKAVMDIVVPASDVTPAEKTAAQELATYLQKVTGATFKTIEESQTPPDAPGLYVGNTRFARKQGLDMATLGEEESVLRTVGQTIILTGGRPRGTLYAVYIFLEETLGCRWYTPWCEIAPRISVCRIPPLDHKRSPRFRMRDVYTRSGRDVEWFSTRNRLNGESARDTKDAVGGWICAGPANHSFWHYLPRKEYFEKHPEYFPERNGKRTGGNPHYPEDNPGEMGLCPSSPDVVRIVSEGVKAEFRKNPAAHYASVSRNDGGLPSLCDCRTCRKLADKYGGEGGLLLWFINQVADAVKTEFPHKYIVTLAYGPTAKAPRGIAARDNVIVWVAGTFHSGRVFNPGKIGDAGYGPDQLVAWTRCAAHVWTWDYVPSFYSPPLDYFLPVLWKMDEEFKFIQELKVVDGVFEEAENIIAPMLPDMFEMRTWILTKLMEDPARNLNGLIGDFLGGYYGAAAPLLRKYLTMIHNRLPRWPWRMLDYTFMHEAQQLFDAAEAAVRADAACLMRVQEWRINLDFAALHFRHQLVRDFIRQGAKVEEYPFPMQLLQDRILRTAAKTANPYLLATRDGKVIVEEGKAYLARLCRGKEFAPLPAQFRSLPPENVVDVMAHQMDPAEGRGHLAADADAALGLALVLEGGEQLPFSIGAYDVALRVTTASADISKEKIPGKGYHWYNLTFPLGKLTYVYCTKGWTWQVYAHMLYDPSAPDRKWDAWISVKFTGPAYPYGDPKDKNAVYVDRIILTARR